MANDITVTKINTSGSERFDVEYSVDASGTKVKTLATSGTMLDRNIKVSVTTPAGDYSAGTKTNSITNSIVTPVVNITRAADFGFSTNVGTVSGTEGVDYLIVDPDANATSWSVTPAATITTAGYIGAGSKNGTVVSQTPSIAGGTNYVVPIVEPNFSGGSLSIGTNSLTIGTAPVVTVTSAGTFKTASTYGVTTTKPSGTDGTNYLTINDSTSQTTQGKASFSGTVNLSELTMSNAAGVTEERSNVTILSAGSQAITKSNVAINTTITDNFAALYIPIVTAFVTGGGLTATGYSGTPTLSFADGSDSNMTNLNLGSKDTTTYPYFFKISGTSSSLSGTTSVSRAAVVLSNSAGAIAANSNVTKIAADSKTASVSVRQGSGNTYLSFKSAAIAASATASATTTVAPGTVSIAADTTSVSGKTRLAISPTTSSPTTTYYIAAKATAAANSTGTTSSISGTASASVSAEGYAGSGLTGTGSVSGTATAKTSAKSSSVTYFPIPAVDASLTGTASGGSATAAISNVNSMVTISDVTNKTAGTDYWAVKATATGANGSYTPSYTVTSAGWLASTVAGSAQTVSVSSDTTGKTIYIPKAVYSTSAGVTTVTTGGYLPTDTVVTNITTQTPTTNYAYTGLDTYFNTGTSSDNNVTITPRYSNSAGYVAAHTNTNNGGIGYWKIKTTSVTQGTSSISNGTLTRGSASWGTGWVSSGSINAATFANTATSGITYLDISNTTDAPMLISGDYLYINKGYVDNLKISLAKLVPDWASGTNVAAAGHILSGYKAYDKDGAVLTGTIPTRTASNISFSGKTVTVTSGYYVSNTTKDMGLATITSGSATISTATFTYNSTSGKFDVSGSATVAAPSVGTIGYISSSEGTKNTNTATLSTTVNKVGIEAAITGTAKVTPTISKITDASGNNATNITAQVSAATTTKPTSGYYVAVKSAATTSDITATPSVTSAGYGTTTDYTANNATLSVGANASSVTYLPVTAGGCTVAGGALSTSGFTKSNLALTLASGSETNMGNITASASKDTTNYPFYFKINGSTPAVSGTTSASVTAITDTHTAGYIPAKSATTVVAAQSATPAVSVNATSGSIYVSLKQATATVSGTNTVTPSAAVSANDNVTLGTTDNGISVTATGGGTASVTAIAKTNAVGYSGAADTQLGSATLNASNNTTTATKYITAINVPKNKAFTLTVASDTALDATSDVTITNGAYRQIQLTNSSSADVNITNAGTIDITQSANNAGKVTINAYDNTSTPALTTAQTVVNNGKWVYTTVTPHITTKQGPYYGAVYVNGMSSGTQAAATVSGTTAATTPTIAKTATTASGATNVASGNASTTAPSSGFFVSVKATAPATTVSLTKTVNTQGYLGANTQITASAATTETASDDYYVPVGSGAYSAANAVTVNGTITPSLGLDTAATSSYGFTTTQPRGTSGTNYLTIDPNASVTTKWKATATASIDTTGYIVSGTKTQEIEGTPDINAGTNYYVPVVTPSFSGGGLSGSTTNAIAVTGMATSSSATSYYIDATATGTASRAAVTYTNSAGVIAAHSGTTASAAPSAINVGSSATRVYIPAASGTTTISGGAVSCDYVSGSTTNVTLSSTDAYTNAVKITFRGSRAALTATGKTTAGYTPSNNSYSSASLAAGTSDSVYYIKGVTLPTPSSGTRQFDITVPNGSTSSWITFHFSVASDSSVTVTEG